MSVAKPAEQQSEKLHGQIKFHWWRLSFHNEICEKKPTLEVGSWKMSKVCFMSGKNSEMSALWRFRASR